MMRYIFFGTPQFAALILDVIIRAGLSPVAVVTNPDRPTGRKKIITPPVAKVIALKNHIPVWQPESLKNENETKKFLNRYPADIAVVAAYAKIIPSSVLLGFSRGVIGVHPSLLPKYRGPTPIQTAIMDGKKETGTTLYQLDSAVDHGPIFAQEKIEITDSDTYETLEKRLADLGSKLLISNLPKIQHDELASLPQNNDMTTFTKKFESKDGYIDPEEFENATNGKNPKIAEALKNKIRALSVEPGVFTIRNGKRMKILDAIVENGALKILRIQFEGKSPQIVTTRNPS